MTEQNGISTRYELKQVYSRLLLPELHSWVKVHPAAFRLTYPPRQVNSIYFDTLDLDTFNDHLEGVPIRRKLRYRWYGTNLGLGQTGQVEVKNKSELAGWKLIEKLDASFDFEHNHWATITKPDEEFITWNIQRINGSFQASSSYHLLPRLLRVR